MDGWLRPDEIDALRAVRELESIYSLLHALVGPSLGDFFVRAAALEALVAAGRAAFSAQDLDDTLYWLDEPARAATLRVLRHLLTRHRGAPGAAAGDPACTRRDRPRAA